MAGKSGAPKRAILVDAMSTVIRFNGELTKYEVLGEFIAELFGVNVPPERIKAIYDRKRTAHEPWAGSHRDKWIQINQEILSELFPEEEKGKVRNAAEHITDRIDRDSSLYFVDINTKEFLREAKRRKIMVIIASNQDFDCLRVLVRNFRIASLFSKIYASSTIGCEKPDPRFFSTILRKEKLLPRNCVMIGNNVKNDILAARQVGLTAVLLDPRNLYPEHFGPRIKALSEFWGLHIF